MKNAAIASVLALAACAHGGRAPTLDPRLEPARAEHGVALGPVEGTPRLELLADGTLLVDGARPVPGDDIPAAIAGVFADLPRQPFFPDDDNPDLRVHPPVELWIDARTPFSSVRPLLRSLSWAPAAATWLRLGVRSSTGESRCLPARLDVFGGNVCYADEQDLVLLEVRAPAAARTPAVRVWWREWTDAEPERREQAFRSADELAARLPDLVTVGPDLEPSFNVDADPETPWQAVVDVCDALTARSKGDQDAIWLRPPDLR